MSIVVSNSIPVSLPPSQPDSPKGSPGVTYLDRCTQTHECQICKFTVTCTRDRDHPDECSFLHACQPANDTSPRLPSDAVLSTLRG